MPQATLKGLENKLLTCTKHQSMTALLLLGYLLPQPQKQYDNAVQSHFPPAGLGSHRHGSQKPQTGVFRQQ